MEKFDLSMRCYYSNGAQTNHHQAMTLKEIPKWVEAYRFTHPNCEAISIKVWLHDEERSSGE